MAYQCGTLRNKHTPTLQCTCTVQHFQPIHNCPVVEVFSSPIVCLSLCLDLFENGFLSVPCCSLVTPSTMTTSSCHLLPKPSGRKHVVTGRWVKKQIKMKQKDEWEESRASTLHVPYFCFVLFFFFQSSIFFFLRLKKWPNKQVGKGLPTVPWSLVCGMMRPLLSYLSAA